MNIHALFDFLKNLAENNNREWFNENKQQFEKIKKDFNHYIDHLIPKIYKVDPSIGHLMAKDCVFRIYRDIRFSPNKDPYKSHFGAYISRGGRKSLFAGYYLHFQPGESFLAAGAYSPSPQNLQEIRYELMDNIKEFKQIIQDSKFVQYFNTIVGEKLKTPPKGFAKDFTDIELLKFKSYEIIHKFDEEKLFSNQLEEYILQLVKVALPYNNFMNKAIQNALSGD